MLTKKQAFWLDIIEQWERSGLSQTAFCKHNNLNVKNFYSYKSFFKQRDSQCEPAQQSPGSFVPLQLNEAGDRAVLTIRVGVVSLDITPNIDEAWVLHWLNILKKDCHDSPQ